MAGSSNTITVVQDDAKLHVVKSVFVADDTNGSIPTAAFGINRNAELVEILYEVGGTAPTASSDLTLVDSHGLDRTLGAGTNLISTADGQAAVVYAATNSVHPIIQKDETLTVTYTNNSANDATGTVTMVFRYL